MFLLPMPAPIPSYRDRAAFWRDSYARSSFVHAAAFVSAMFRDKVALYSVERDAFTIAMLPSDGEAGFHGCQPAPAFQATVCFYREL